MEKLMSSVGFLIDYIRKQHRNSDDLVVSKSLFFLVGQDNFKKRSLTKQKIFKESGQKRNVILSWVLQH